MKESVMIVNNSDEEIGTMEKYETYQTFSVLIFNSKNELLLQRKVSKKSHSTGLWTTTCYGEFRSNEDLDKTIRKHLKEEISLDCKLKKICNFAYQYKIGTLVKNEYHHVFFGKTDDSLNINSIKVGKYTYLSIPDIFEQITQKPDKYTTLFKLIINNHLKYCLHRIIYDGKKNVSRRFKYSNIYTYDLGIYSSVYQSQLCQAIKAKLRIKEGKVGKSACLDFGIIRYHIANHFGFCLGVANAIDIAYKALAENLDQDVYLLSELIHNKFVNDDLKNRGLQFLQNDKGIFYKDKNGNFLWDKLKKNDVVIIPAFGATLEDKNKLLAKGINITTYDATCRLVENVWLRGKKLGKQGYTLILHGKSEHEETKATFSYVSQYAPILIVRNLEEAIILIELIKNKSSDKFEELFFKTFSLDKYKNPKCSSGFDPNSHLERLAVINQTTLLARETLEIAKLFKTTIIKIFGQKNLDHHFGKTKDTLCYATNANQGALEYMLDHVNGNLGIVVGGQNSSNTSQLYKLLKKNLNHVFYIQSENNILNKNEILHYNFEEKTFSKMRFLNHDYKFNAKEPINILLTGGASSPDGLIQQIISKINSFFPKNMLKSMDDIIKSL